MSDAPCRVEGMENGAGTEDFTDSGGRVAAAEEALNARDLALLVIQSVLDGAKSGTQVRLDVDHDEVVLVGNGVSSIIQNAVVRAVKELIEAKALLSAPIQAAVKQLEAAKAELQALWDEMEALEQTLESGGEKPKVAPPPPYPLTDTTERPVVAPPKAEAAPSPPKAAKEPQAAEPAAPPDKAKPEVPPTQAAPLRKVAMGDPVINGLQVQFTAKTPESFRSFFAEFLPIIQQRPISPRDAFEMAQRHGYKASLNTLRYQLDAYLGVMKKFKTADGEAMWSLPQRKAQ